MSKSIGSLWKNGKQGENLPIATGNIEVVAGYPIKVALFKNKQKVVGSKQPDYRLVISEQKPIDKTAPKIVSAGTF